jgi:hypothetical protein
MLGRKIFACLATVAVAASLAACGGSGSSGVSPSAYVKSICNAIGPFEKDVATRSSALNLSNITSAAQGKQALQAFLAAIVTDTEQAVNKLKAAGTPNVNNGKKISAAIVSAFTEVKTTLTQAKTQAGNLPTTDPTAFKNAAQSLGNGIRTSMANIGASLTNLKSAELEAAAKKEPACNTLGA